MKKLSLFLLVLMIAGLCNAQVDSAGLNAVFSRKGTVTGDVYRVTFPRSDLKIMIVDFPLCCWRTR
jgi:hypothetical protein